MRLLQADKSKPLNLDEPMYDQSTYVGRTMHFFKVTNPINLLVPGKQLEDAKQLVTAYRLGGKAPAGVTEKDLWEAKYQMDSAFHPETGEKMNLFGRMSAQVPCNMTITGCMMTWYKTNTAVFAWQWINQSFNALVNYTNRSGDKVMSDKQILQSYVVATSAATATALGFKVLVKSMPPIVSRFVPYVAVVSANCVNIPFMRVGELSEGIPVFDKDGRCVGTSTEAGKKAISSVLISRIAMCTPGMLIPPFLMERLEKRPMLARMPWLGMPVQVMLVGFFLTFMTPMGCALYPQKSSLLLSNVEEGSGRKIMDEHNMQPNDRVYFNKGL